MLGAASLAEGARPWMENAIEIDSEAANVNDMFCGGDRVLDMEDGIVYNIQTPNYPNLYSNNDRYCMYN
jgi:hypothetical protein